jgi:hypothetical protein
MSNRQKLILAALISWIAGAASFIVLSLIIAEPPSIADLAGIAVLSAIAVGVNTVLLYLPGLYWLRRRRGNCEPAILFAAAAGLVLNIPAIIISALQSGATMARTEALFFAVMMIAAGAIFGFAFARIYKQPAIW